MTETENRGSVISWTTRWRTLALRRPGLAFALVLGVLLAVLYAPALWGGESFFARDLYNFHYPLWKATADAFRQSGELPLWNPLLNFGQNAVSDPNYLLFYPPAWIRFAVDPLSALNLFIVGHLLLGGVTFRSLLRRWGASNAAAAYGGAAWAGCGVATSLTSLLTLIPYLALVPLTLLALETLVRTPSPRSACRLALAGALIVPVFEPVLVCGLLLCALARLAAAFCLARTRRERLFPLLAAAAALAAAVLTTLPLLSEGVRGVRLSPRAVTAPGDVAPLYHRHPATLHALFVPNPFAASFRLTRTYQGGEYSGGQEPYFPCIFLGFSSLLLAGVALADGKAAGRALVAATAVFTLLSAGVWLPALGDWLARSPLLGGGRYPEKLLFFASGAWLAAVSLGLTRLGRAAPSSRRTLRWGLAAGLAAAVGVTALAALIPGSRLESLWPWPMLAFAGVGLAAWGTTGGRLHRGGLHAAGFLLVVEIILGSRFAAPTAPREAFTSPAPVLEAVRRLPGSSAQARTAFTPPPPGLRFMAKTDSLVWFYQAQRHFGISYCGIAEGIAYAYDDIFDNLEFLGTAALRQTARALPPEEQFRLFALTGVKWFLSPFPVSQGGVSLLGLHPTGASGRVALYNLEESRGRAVLKTAAAPVGRNDAPIQRLLAAGNGTALVPAPFAGQGIPAEGGAGLPAAVLSAGFNEVEIQTDSPLPGVLVLHDTYDPGWKAWTDGRESPLFPADYVFRGVRLEAGRHRVRFAFSPPGWRWMIPLALLCLAGLLYGAGRKPRPPGG